MTTPTTAPDVVAERDRLREQVTTARAYAEALTCECQPRVSGQTARVVWRCDRCQLLGILTGGQP